jgi:RimJ/RimL family protein N-acetyltransferase
VTWLNEEGVMGGSSCDKIHFGEHAYMHLHVVKPDARRQGGGTECVRQSIEIYFSKLKLKRLFCEPNAFNVGAK